MCNLKKNFVSKLKKFLCQNSKNFENYETFLLLGKNTIYADFSFHKSNNVLIAKILCYFFLIIIIRLYISSFMCSINCQLIAFPF